MNGLPLVISLTLTAMSLSGYAVDPCSATDSQKAVKAPKRDEDGLTRGVLDAGLYQVQGIESNSEPLVAMQREIVAEPKVPSESTNAAATRSGQRMKKAQFGHARRDDFSFAAGYTNINHGSFGATPKVVAEFQRGQTANMEAKPDDWFRKGYRAIVTDVRPRLATYVHAQSDDVVLVENASSGVNAVLRGLQYILGSDDVVAVLSTAYPMVSNTLNYLASEKGFRVEIVDVKFPVESNTDFLVVVEKLLATVPADKLKIFVVSHIISVPAVVVPIVEMAEVLKSVVPSLHIVVDGAHALGQIPLNMTSMEEAGVDYYIANGHKWLYSPKGTAFLWVSKAQQAAIVPTVVSSEGQGSFADVFLYTGTRDYTAFCSIGAALDYRDSLGDDDIISYTHDLASNAGKLLSEMWATRTVAPATMYGSMVDVQLPTADSQKVAEIRDKFVNDYDMYIVVYQLSGSEPPTFWTRLSAQIYLELSDFERVGSLVLEIVALPKVEGQSFEPIAVLP